MSPIRKHIETFLTLDPAKYGRWMAFLIYQLRLYIQIARQLVRDNCLQQAASLAFTTLLSMVPVVALIFSMFNSFANLQKYERHLQDFLQKHLLADSASEAFDKIMEFSQNISAVNDIVSVVFFLVFSLGLFNTIEATINFIWKVKKSRSLFDRFITYWIMVTLGPLLLVVSLQISLQIKKIAYLGALITTLMNIFPMSFIVIALTFVYKLVPNTKVKWKAAIIGGVVAGILFELAKNGFNLYVTRIAYYNSIYLSLTTLVFFLLWVYVAWIIILFGTEISYTIQNLSYLYQKDREDKLRLKRQAEQSVVNEFLGVRVFWLIARAFRSGKEIITVKSIAEHFNLSPEIIEEVVRRLRENGFVIATASDSLVPARSLDTLKVKEIFSSFLVDFPPSNPSRPLHNSDFIDDIVADMETARMDTVGELTIRELLKKGEIS